MNIQQNFHFCYYKLLNMLLFFENKKDFEICDIEYKLLDNSNDPIIHLYKCENVKLYNLKLDGNKDNQEFEISKSFGYNVRNNCISLRRCKNIEIYNCVLTNARSGGIVPVICNDVTIKSSLCSNNYFDGIAPYESENISIIDCTLSNNKCSGVSVDGRCQNINIINSTLLNNFDWGIWYGYEQDASNDYIVEICKCNTFVDNKSGNVCVKLK